MRDTPDVTIVTVSYNSSGVLPALLDSRPKGVPTVIVDNASDDVAVTEALAGTHSSVSLISNLVNIGFGAACNRGAAVARTEFLLFLNPDAVLGEGALDTLITAAGRHPDAVGFNPKIINANGRQSFKRRSSLLPRRDWLKDLPVYEDAVVPVLAGSAIFVRKNSFDAIGGFDEEIILYHEDDDLSLRLSRIGPLMLVADAEVTHLGGSSTVRSAQVAAIKAFHMGRSRVYALAKYGRPAPWLRTVLMALGQLLSPEMLFSARKRAKYLAFLKGAWSARSDGGRSRVNEGRPLGHHAAGVETKR